MAEEGLYDEDEAYEYILDKLKDEYPDLKKDDVEYVLDLVSDYYETSGFFDEDQIVDIDEDEIFDHVTKEIEKDNKSDKYDDVLVSAILEGEFEYCDKMGIFEDDDEE